VSSNLRSLVRTPVLTSYIGFSLQFPLSKVAVSKANICQRCGMHEESDCQTAHVSKEELLEADPTSFAELQADVIGRGAKRRTNVLKRLHPSKI
jgi:hypothetical protein